MTKRILLAGLLGGLAMFIWQSVAHVVLPLGEAGIQALPNEPAIQAAVKATIREAGFYLFPAPESRPGMSSTEKQQAMERATERRRIEPAGIMIVHPYGFPMPLSTQLAKQFALDFLAILLAAMLLSFTTGFSYDKRVVFIALMGLLPALTVEIPHNNWYGFPQMYVVAQSVTHLVGFIVAGLFVAKVVNPSAT